MKPPCLHGIAAALNRSSLHQELFDKVDTKRNQSIRLAAGKRLRASNGGKADEADPFVRLVQLAASAWSLRQLPGLTVVRGTTA